jgi:hypothetical protein
MPQREARSSGRQVSGASGRERRERTATCRFPRINLGSTAETPQETLA